MRSLLISGWLALATLTLGCSDDNGKTPDAGKDQQVIDASVDGPTPDTAKVDAPPQADGQGQTDKGSSDGKGPDTTSVSFSGQVQPIFSASCATSLCHAGTAPKANLNLSSGVARQALVNVTSIQCATLKRVAPGSPTQSYLVQKLEGSGSCFTLTKMPQGGSLTTTQINTIRTWITEGAVNN